MNSVSPDRSLRFPHVVRRKVAILILLIFEIVQVASINFIDVEEYPAMAEIESRCVNMLARLFHAPLDNPESEACGVSTVGSSEAIILAVLAAKRRWKKKRQAEGKSVSSLKPVLVFSFWLTSFGGVRPRTPTLSCLRLCTCAGRRLLAVSNFHSSAVSSDGKADKLFPQISRSKRGTVGSHVPSSTGGNSALTDSIRSPTGYCRKGVYLAEPQELVDLVDENTVLLVGILGTVSSGYKLALRLTDADFLDKHPRPTRVDTKTSKRSMSCSSRRTRRPVSTSRCMCKFLMPRLPRRVFSS